MSKQASEEFITARFQQATRNDARRIRQRVEAARLSPERAGIRWPFELMQNAHDAGPRDGDELVKVTVTLEDERLVVSHTGAPFSAVELAALLSGGSSKEFDSEETTGRFGTGFLVTHALSTRVDVKGVLTTESGPELFRIKLDRGGDEDSLTENIEQASQSLNKAKFICKNPGAKIPRAEFSYRNPNMDVALQGLDRLEQTLPYLYSTCPKLGPVCIKRSDNEVSFAPDKPTECPKGGFHIRQTPVTILSSGSERTVKALSVWTPDRSTAILAVLERREDGGYEVLLPDDGLARVFVTFPIAGTNLLKFNVVVNGKFAPLQERDGIAMHDHDKKLIVDALAALPFLVQHAVESEWRGAHNLARIAVPDRTIGGENVNAELKWWRSVLMNTAKEIGARPVIQTDEGLRPALSCGADPTVSFPVPAIHKGAETSVDWNTMHEVASAVTTMKLPSKHVAQDWQEIARLWADTGVSVDRFGLAELTHCIGKKAGWVDELPVRGNQIEWLGKLFGLAADMGDQNVQAMVKDLLPDQYGKFRNSRSLSRDGGISEEVKVIARLAGKDLCATLLNAEFSRIMDHADFEEANELIRGLTKDTYVSESEAIQEILDLLGRVLESGLRCSNIRLYRKQLQAAARLASFFADKRDIDKLRKCPLLSAGKTIVRLGGSGQQILAPSKHWTWTESERQYTKLYKEDRLLHNVYHDNDVLREALEKLIRAELVIPAPLFRGRCARIEDEKLLRLMAQNGEDTSDLTVQDQNFGQIAFLSTELIQRCWKDSDQAKRLLEFVLKVAAKEDPTWREYEMVKGERRKKPVDVLLNRATWPFELQVRSWIPIERPDMDGKDSVVRMPASESNLRDILDPKWLEGNDAAVDLLRKVFGFKQWTFLSDRSDEETTREIVKLTLAQPEARGLALELNSAKLPLNLVREFVRDMEEDEGLAEHLTNRREQVRTIRENENIGRHVEDLVRQNLKQAGFIVAETGVGSDFEIETELGDVITLELGRSGRSWLVEVKSTRGRTVRMTGAQARTAAREGERFLLCVVPIESGGSNADAEDVKSNMRFVADIGTRVTSLCDDLRKLEDMRSDITSEESRGVQLEISPGATRVRVASGVWENDGFPLDELAERLLTHAR